MMRCILQQFLTAGYFAFISSLAQHLLKSTEIRSTSQLQIRIPCTGLYGKSFLFCRASFPIFGKQSRCCLTVSNLRLLFFKTPMQEQYATTHMKTAPSQAAADAESTHLAIVSCWNQMKETPRAIKHRRAPAETLSDGGDPWCGITRWFS